MKSNDPILGDRLLGDTEDEVISNTKSNQSLKDGTGHFKFPNISSDNGSTNSQAFLSVNKGKFLDFDSQSVSKK